MGGRGGGGGGRSETPEVQKGSAALLSTTRGTALLRIVGGCCPLMGMAHSFVLFFKEGLSEKYFKQHCRGIPKGCWKSLLRVLFPVYTAASTGKPSL